jgi:hypothetical protein
MRVVKMMAAMTKMVTFEVIFLAVFSPRPNGVISGRAFGSRLGYGWMHWHRPVTLKASPFIVISANLASQEIPLHPMYNMYTQNQVRK